MSLTYAAQQSETNSGYKTAAIVAVVLLHLAALYGLTHGMKMPNIVKPLTDTVTVFIPDEKPVEPPPQPPKLKDLPKIEQVVPDIAEPTPPVDVPMDIPTTTPTSESTITPTTTEPTLTKSFSIKHQVNPIYPSASRRAGETGTVLLSVVVTPDGTPSDVEIERSSGFAALDQAAVEAVRKWRFKVNGADGSSRLQLPITFKLES